MYTDERYIPTLTPLARSMYYYVQHMGLSTFDDTFRMERRDFPSLLFTYSKSGCGILEYRDQVYEVGEGTMMLINCRYPHVYYTRKGTHWEQTWLHFYGGESEAYFQAIYQAAGPVQAIQKDADMLSFLENLISLKRNNDPHFEIRASSIIVQLLTDILILSKQTATGKMNEFVTKTVTSIILEMDKHIGKAYQVADMAKHVCMSQSRFAELFKQAMGIPPYEYLIRRRIEASKGLLNGTTHAVSEIAQMVGFDSASHFIRTFGKFESISPHRYRSLFLY
jgi:AraC family transcriptional regulator